MNPIRYQRPLKLESYVVDINAGSCIDFKKVHRNAANIVPMLQNQLTSLSFLNQELQ
jgi:carbonic anhydrase